MKKSLFLLIFGALPTFAALTSGTPEEAVAQIDELVQKGKAKPAEISELTAALKDPDANVRVKERAAWALGELNAKSAVPTLIKSCEHKGLLVRSAAMNALIRMRSSSAVPTLISIAQKDLILALRQNATLGLGLIGGAKAVQPIADLSTDPTPEVRGASVLAMAAMHSTKNNFGPIIKEMQADDNPYVQERAEMASEMIRKKNAAVLERLSSSDADIRLYAAKYFQKNGTSKELNKLKTAWNSEADEETRAQLKKSTDAIQQRAAEAKAAAAAKAKAKAAEAAKKPKP